VGVEWTFKTLLIHLKQMIEDSEKKTTAVSAERLQAINNAVKSVEEAAKIALAASEKATAKAEAASEKRFEGVNEFRKALSDQSNTFIARTEVDAKLSAFDKEQAGLVSRMDRIEGRNLGQFDTEKSHRDNTALYVAIIAAVLAAIGLFIANYHKV
jgi:hypothetical protein